MLSSVRRITTRYAIKASRASSTRLTLYKPKSRHTINVRRIHQNNSKLHHIISAAKFNRNNTIKATHPITSLCRLESHSFCTPKPAEINRFDTIEGDDRNTLVAKYQKAKFKFAVEFLYLPFLAMMIGAVFYREEILTYFMQQIFQRRESFLIRCYPKRIILIRHGQSAANIDQLALATIPDHEIKLTHMGYKQALEAGRKLKELIGDEHLYAYYSPYNRAQETLYGILEGGNLHKQTKVQIEDVRLIEQKFGNKQNKEQMEQEKKWRLQYGRYFYQFKYGESGLDVTLRATAFTDRLFDHFRTGYYSTRPNIEWNVLIVSHGLFMRVFLKSFLRRTVADFQKWYNYANCEMCILIKQKDGEYCICTTTPLPLTPRKRTALND